MIHNEKTLHMGGRSRDTPLAIINHCIKTEHVWVVCECMH